jgi:hypothetical protein
LPDLPTPLQTPPISSTIDTTAKNSLCVWIEKNEGVGRISSHNILKRAPGITPVCRRKITEEEVCTAFLLLFDDSVVRRIITCTEQENLRRYGSNGWHLTREELLGFIGMLFIRGATCSSKLECESMWSDKWGLPIFKQTMTRMSFRKIMQNLRFDELSYHHFYHPYSYQPGYFLPCWQIY